MIDVQALAGSLPLQREHQIRAVRATLDALLVREQRGVVLADEVGCGKTYEALGVAALLWKHLRNTDRPIERILIVAKPVLMQKWFGEIEASPRSDRGFQQYIKGAEWADFRSMLDNIVQLQRRDDGVGSGVRKDGKLQVPSKRVYLVKPTLLTDESSEDASMIVRWLRRTDWDLVIADEAHHYARLHTKTSQVFFPDQRAESRDHGLNARFILALTATPFQLSTSEILNLLRVVRASDADVASIADALPRYERALEAFYARRQFPASDPARRRHVERLQSLRLEDASAGQHVGTPGLEHLLRRYVVRNVKDAGLRDYAIAEHAAGVYGRHAFDKLDDVRRVLNRSPLLGFEGTDALVYLHLRDLVADASVAASESPDSRPTFVAGDLRQGLSSYEQLAASSLIRREDLKRAPALRGMLDQLAGAGHRHPKIRALAAVVDAIVVAEIQKLHVDPAAVLSKIVVFNTLMKTAGALRTVLEETVRARVEPFIDEEITAAGWPDRDAIVTAVRGALNDEHATVREQLHREFKREHLMLRPEHVKGTPITMASAERDVADVMFERLKDHCTQPLFLLRMARWFRALGNEPSAENAQLYLMRRVGGPLALSLNRIVDQYLDDTPWQGEAFSSDNVARARREIARLANVLAAPEYVARFDGEQGDSRRELRRENFNRPYAPLVLLVSAVGEEGIDLQQHTRYLLHYDVEWNPAKMEQREGRVDREGRRTRNEGAVQVQFFLLKETYEERIFHTVMQRDAWFQILIGSKRQELARGVDVDVADDANIDLGEIEQGQLTADERERVMLNLRP